MRHVMGRVGKGQDFIHFPKPFPISHGEPGSPLVVFFQSRELTDTQGRGDIGHIVFESGLQDLGQRSAPPGAPVIRILAQPVKFQTADSLQERGIV